MINSVADLPHLAEINCDKGYKVFGERNLTCEGTTFRYPPGICKGMLYYTLVSGGRYE